MTFPSSSFPALRWRALTRSRRDTAHERDVLSRQRFYCTDRAAVQTPSLLQPSSELVVRVACFLRVISVVGRARHELHGIEEGGLGEGEANM